jgi:putative ABC transport system substrate-binding protein
VAILWNAANPANAAAWQEMQAAARALGLRLYSQEVRSPQDFEGAFARTVQAHPDAFLVLQDSLITMHRQPIVAFVTQQHLPSLFFTKEWVVAGGLMSYGPSFPDLFRRAATYVDKILKGVKPADLPVEQPMRFELVINLKTAKQIGLTIPQWTLMKADQVIQ